MPTNRRSSNSTTSPKDRTRLAKVRKNTDTIQGTQLKTGEIDWTVFGLDIEPAAGGRGPGATLGPAPGPLVGTGGGGLLPGPEPQRTVQRKHSGVRLEALPASPKAPFDAADLSHLKSAVKRTPGYIATLPPLAKLLEDRGVDYATANADRDVQLPLEAFDDTTMCSRTPEEWVKLMRDPVSDVPMPLACRALKLNEDGSGRWQNAIAHGWDVSSMRYLVKWANGEDDKVLAPHLLFDGDDPILFADRLAKALRNRRYANSLLKYHFFIESMPEDRSRRMSRDSMARMVSLARAVKSLNWDKHSDFADILDKLQESLKEEVHREYTRVQNAITFDKVRNNGGLNSLPVDLTLPPPEEPPEVPYLGVKEIPTWDPSMGPPDPALPRGFAQAMEWFCRSSLLLRPEVCAALQETQRMCLSLLTDHVFETQFSAPMRLAEFIERQEGAIMRIKSRLGMWVNTIRQRITQRLQQATEQWYHLNETSLENYRASHLRRLLVTARMMMSNAFLLLAEDNLEAYAKSIESVVPSRLELAEGSPWDVDESGLGPLKRVTNFVPDPKVPGAELAIEPFFKQSLFRLEVKVNEKIFEPAEPPKEDKKDDKKKGKKDDKKEPEKPKEIPPAFCFTTEPTDVEKAVSNIFFKGISAFHDVHSVESVLLPHLIREDSLDPNFKKKDPWVVNIAERIMRACEIHQPWLQQVIKLLDEYRDVAMLDPEAQAKAIRQGDPPPPEAVRAMILDKQARMKQVMEGLADDKEPVPIGFYRLDTSAVRQSMIEKLDMTCQNLLQCLSDQLGTDIEAATAAFSDLFTKLKTEVSDIEGCAEQKDFLKSIPGELSKLQGAINDAMNLTALVEDLRFELPSETLDARWVMFGSPGDVKREMSKVEDYLDERHKSFLATQDQEQIVFDTRLEELEKVVEGFGQYDDIAQVNEVAEMVKNLNEEIKQCQDLVRLYNSREVLFDRDQTDYSNLGTMVKNFEPYSNLWKTAGDWVSNKESWLKGAFDSIDPKYCENEVTGGIRLLFKTIRTLSQNEETKGIAGIAEQIKLELEEFKPYLPLVTGLRNEGMRARHWTQISDKCGVDVGPDMEGGFTLKRLLDLGLLNYVQDVAEVGDRAGKEFTLEKTLNKMKEDWEPLNFDLTEKYRKTGTYTLKGDGEAMALLDEHIVTTQAMMFSMFKGPFEEQIDEWNARLMRVSETLEEWKKCEKAWCYLQPIFDSDDIMRQLPTEGKRFKHVDATWRQEMNHARENPKIIDVCATEGLLEKWRECNVYLDMVQKGLEDYLETKRNGFARFYFLSNDELLEILSQTKDPTRVQPFLSKVFEAMAKVTFTPDNEILNMISPEGEIVPFVNPVITEKKNVEVWMCELEDFMRIAVRQSMENGILSYPNSDRPEWVLDNTAQIVLNGSQVHWTAEVEGHMSSNTVPVYAKQLEDQIDGLVNLFRKGLTKMQRITVGALVVIDVHAKEIIKGFAETGINDASSFEWISQLRYYWEMDDRNAENCYVKCVQTSFPYGYEYLGNSFRLVITPLTDMCYITLMGAQALSLGGAPAGPAGTGKTETTKDLAKALAKQCVVFNCSPEMDYIMVGKFFKGLAFTGAWCCFDEFNRINIEVLSVIAQQLLVLFGKKAEMSSYNDTKELEFEGTHIVMKPTFNVFITMNPGYAGRAELPDNLAALFRPVAMMVPDYALIGQIMFYAFGFTDAQSLAKKMVTTFTLSSEQLSSQCHYDYGMRAVKSTIEMCGKLKRELGDLPEDQITLRALRDVNVPKFLKDDLPLFENIITDLFPTTPKPVVEYGNLTDALKKCGKNQNLQLTENFVIKVVQLIDTIGVRHGLMLVGPTGGGKTCNFRLLQETSILLNEEGDPKYQKVQTHILNPKSITQAQLYGAFDEVTREWSDGVASECVRTAVASGKSGCPDNHWVIFDGPVDALWIESMNTVLDDNKKLCLTSGEIIALTPLMRMVFEVEDLSVASPATVSRCGMVYMEPSALGNEPLVQSWTERLPKTFKKEHIECVNNLMLNYCLPMVPVVRKRTKEPSITADNNLVCSHFRLMDCYFHDYIPTEAKTPNADEMGKLLNCMKPLFFFTLIWSVGATCDNKGRKKFSDELWELVQGNGETFGGEEEPEPGSFVYDKVFTMEEGRWQKWFDFAPKYTVPPRSEYQNIVVPTVDSIRLTHTFATLMLKDKHVIVAGNTGTGKSVYITLWLQKDAPDNILPLFISFSAQTHVNQLQDLLDSKFEKRRRGVFGPPAGKRNIIFVDDLNMPKKEYYGAQPPIELIRQWMDYGGWYDRKELKVREIIDIVHVSAMGPPGGGRTEISGRLKRHYNAVVAADMSRDSIENIFSTILAYFLAQGFDKSIQELVNHVVGCSIDIFERAGDDLLPTPAKSHYTFNLRDIWKVFQGICSLKSKKVSSPVVVVRCFCHENLRVYGDRLINGTDRKWMREQLDNAVSGAFGMKPDNVFDKELLLFGDFMEQGGDTKFYVEIEDLGKMKTQMEGYLDDYNNMFAVAMPLVMFSDACEHVARICRVLRQPNGNALLLGVGGSGRQSLSRLASFMSEYDCFQIEVVKGYGMNEFKEDLKTCLLKCGCELKTQTFLFADTQIVNENMVESLNNVLNSGDVPNLYKGEDVDTIMQACRAACQQSGIPPTKANVFNTYIMRVKANVHVVLAFSPVGDAFRTRLRMFPSLVNCCTIDWFAEWPEEALYSVGKQQMTIEDLQLPNLEGILSVFALIHQSVEKAAAKVLDTLKRAIYITPTSFLELIGAFKKVLGQRRNAVGTQRNRLQKGLDALGQAAYAVANMEEDIKKMQPVLKETTVKVADMMVVITEDKAKAAVTKADCEKVEAEAKEQADAATAIKEDAQKDLDEALPALDVAEKALKALKLASLQEIKALGDPPAGVRLTCECVCILFGIKPVKKADPANQGKKFDDYWEPSQKILLNEPKKLLEDLFAFDKDNIPEAIIQKVDPYIGREDFDPDIIKKASVACEALCKWARAMHKYHFVAKAVEPKRQMLREAEASLEVTMRKLRAAQAELKEVEDKIAKLEADFNAAVQKQEDLKNEMASCEVKLQNATKLIDGLGGEKERWGLTVQKLGDEYALLPGDSLIASGMVSYAGAFTGEHRTNFEDTWLKKTDELKITHKEGASLVSVLGEPVVIQQWSVAGLPNDNLSVENGIIIATARRWPLMIDPQRQANKFIKSYGKVASDQGMGTCKLSDTNLLQTVELGIQFGKWILLENIGENLDPALEPVLQQQKIKDGTSYVIKLGDKNVSYDEKFRFFMTTTLSNPHYSPETSVKVTLLNFAITPEGLQDQMLGIVVQKEQPEMEEKKQELVKNSASMNKQLKDIEDDILRLLSADGDILESKELIDTLEYSKVTNAVIGKALEEAKVTEVEIDEVRRSYKDYAFRAQLLFFCVAELSVIDPMYQFSLQWFQQLAGLGIDNAPAGDTPEVRLANLIAFFTYSIYQSVCRGLFEKHKLLFSFSLTMKIMSGEGRLDVNEVRFLLTGPTGEVKDGGPNPAPQWLSDKSWNEILTLAKLPALNGFDHFFAAHTKEFQKVYDVPEADEEPIPGDWNTKLSPLEKMCFLRALRPDRLTTAVLAFVMTEMGQKFVEPPVFDIAISFEDSTKMSPLIFVLSAGSDPVNDMVVFAETRGMTSKLESISLGQGQGPRAKDMIEKARESGGWVLLCNCHLSISWLPTLEQICEQQNAEETDNAYRLWLTSMPTKQFPALLLQNGVKMTNEPPKGLRANVLGSMMKIDDRMLSDCEKPDAHAKLIFGFCFFHAVCQDRRKFGPIGWNIPYNFTPEDLVTNRRQLKYFLDNMEEIPYKVLQFLGAKINYGGRVTDKKDKVLIETMIKIFICEDVVVKGADYKFSPGGLFYCPNATSQDEFLTYLRNLPIMTPPEVFGLDANCEITCAESESMSLLADVVALSASGGGGGGGGKSAEDVMDELAAELEKQTPPVFDLDQFEEKFQTMYSESRNTVIKQEAAKYNRLISKLILQLPLFRKAVKGFVVMTEDLEEVGKGLFTNQVPGGWGDVGFLSLKPLTSWYKDLNERVAFFNRWYSDGHPISFWISGLFFPQAFLTAVLQNFARAHKFAIDRVNFDTEVVDHCKLDGSDLLKAPEAGSYFWGMYLEGCRWCDQKHALAPSHPKVLFVQLPVVLFKPELDWKPRTARYPCPVYKVLSRKGTLSTTGHSTNFVRDMEVNTLENPDNWIRAGVAAFLALKY